MKFWFLLKLKIILHWLAKATLKKYQPGIIGVTGSVGKTSTKGAIYTVLRNFRQTRASAKNFNNELGLPLTILGDWQEPSWFKVVLSSFFRLIFGKKSNYPEMLILEYGADRPGDLDYLLDIAKPQIAVITAIGDMPAHMEYYDSPESVAKEKAKIARALPSAGFAVLNYDDKVVLNIEKSISAPVFTFGFGEGAQMRVSDFENRNDEGRPSGIIFKLEYNNNSVPVRIDGAFGKAQAYAAAAAACVGVGFGFNLQRIAEALAYYKPPPHRMRFLMGIKDTYLIDDCYNASPLSMRAAFETIKDLPAKRKVGILGDMLELGQYTIEAHEQIGQLAAKTFNLLITVGPRAKFIADAARKKGFSEEKIKSFDTVEEASNEVLGLLKSGDLVLIKASRGIKLDKLLSSSLAQDTAFSRL